MRISKIFLIIFVFVILFSAEKNFAEKKVITKNSEIPNYSSEDIIFKGCIRGQIVHLTRICTFFEMFVELKGLEAKYRISRSEGDTYPTTLYYTLTGPAKVISELEEKINKYIRDQSPWVERIDPDNIKL